MSTHFSTSTRLDRLNLSSANPNDDDSVVSTASSISDSDFEDDERSEDKIASTLSTAKKMLVSKQMQNRPARQLYTTLSMPCPQSAPLADWP